MSDEQKFKAEFAPGAADDLPPDVRDALLAEMQAMLDLGGHEALMQHYQPRAVRFINVATARCCVCRGVLTRDKDFDDEYVCTATGACKEYVYCDELSEEAQLAIQRLEALNLDE